MATPRPKPSGLLQYLGSPFVTLVLVIALGFSLLIVVPKFNAYALPGNQLGYEPHSRWLFPIGCTPASCKCSACTATRERRRAVTLGYPPRTSA